MVAVVNNGWALARYAAGAVLCFDPPKEPLAAVEVTCEIDPMAGDSFGSILFSPGRRWVARCDVRGAGGDNRPADPFIMCNHTEQVSVLHSVEAGDLGQK
jgi:hypothetical protein